MYSRLGACNREEQQCHGSQQLIHLCTNLFCLSAVTLCGYSHSLCRHMLLILHPPKQAGKSFWNIQQRYWQLMCWNAQDEKYFFLNLTKSPCHAKCILLSADSCPSLPRSFPDLNCKNHHSAEGGVQALELLHFLFVQTWQTWQVAPRQVQAPPWWPTSTRVRSPCLSLLLSLCLPSICTAWCWWARAAAQAAVMGCKQDPFAQGFSRRASLELALKIYTVSCEPIHKWPDNARAISERLKHLKCRCTKDTCICH